MPPAYLEPPDEGPLAQGEILKDVWELRPKHPASEPGPRDQPPFKPIHHPLIIILSAACDLEWDFKARFPESGDNPTEEELEASQSVVPYVLLCDLHAEATIRTRTGATSELWKRIRQNQDERYHRLAEGSIGDSGAGSVEQPLFLDFKKTIALPTAGLYEATSAGSVEPLAIVPPVYVHDLIQRYYSFLSRIGIPD